MVGTQPRRRQTLITNESEWESLVFIDSHLGDGVATKSTQEGNLYNQLTIEYGKLPKKTIPHYSLRGESRSASLNGEPSWGQNMFY